MLDTDLHRLRLALSHSIVFHKEKEMTVDKLPVIQVKLAFNKPIKSTLFT